ncbi:MAG: transcriptional regulator [Spirochaetaceae bacterium]|nr:MAG: transcriptional regulator [Spirochaetaceae bacterium]
MQQQEITRGLQELSEVLTRITDAELMKAFLSDLLTERERSELAGRWELLKRLHAGQTQRSIAEALGMSLCKITRGSRELKKPHSAVLRVVENWRHGT